MNISKTLRKATFYSTAAAIALISAPASAQGSDSGASQVGLDIIVVTAQRREQNVQDIPIAISAFSPEELEARGVANTLELTQFVPNLIANNSVGLGAANAYFIRGIGNVDEFPTFDPPIGTYVDEVYIARQNANNLNLFDVERVEVLRGPQGTLFGRNTTGGAINIVLRKPDDKRGGYAEIGYGSYDRILARASVDVPVGNDAAVKVSGYYQNDDGYVDNISTGETLNDNDGWGVRAAGRVSLGIFEWNLAYAHIAANGENILNFPCDSFDPGSPANCDRRFATTGVSKIPSTAFSGITGRKANFGLGATTDMDLVTSNIELELGSDFSVNLITGYSHLIQKYNIDFFDGRDGPTPANPYPTVRKPPLPFGGFNILSDMKNYQLTQEIRLNGSVGEGLVDFVAGGYYFYEKTRTDFADVFGAIGFPLLLADRVLKNKTEAFALYGQADVHVTDQVTLTAGLRWTDETKDFSISDNRPSVGGILCRGPNQFGPSPCLNDSNLFALNGTAIPTRQTISMFTPRFAVAYKPSDDLMLFASATRGFKSGGWNPRGTAPSELLPFGPETTWSYETGFRSEFWGRRARLNVTAYLADTADLQTPAAFLRTNNTIAFITRNFADYQNYGIEAELTLVPADGLNVFASLGWEDDKYKIDRNAPTLDQYGVQSVAAQQAQCQAAIGMNAASPACGNGIVTLDGKIAEQVRTPDWSLSGGMSYEIALGSNWTITPSVNGTYRSSFEVSTSSVSVYQTSDGNFNTVGNGRFVNGSHNDGYFLVNAAIVLAEVEDGLRFSLNCSNCFNQDYNSSVLVNTTYYNAPGTWLATARHNF